mmetsp:Transcript_16017/g.36809  ORF Transcript_16017/g.36809 Transcript_16017/m.36809 type:complete len:325 (-) Transcript_16017:89-1063(-)
MTTTCMGSFKSSAWNVSVPQETWRRCCAVDWGTRARMMTTKTTTMTDWIPQSTNPITKSKANECPPNPTGSGVPITNPNPLADRDPILPKDGITMHEQTPCLLNGPNGELRLPLPREPSEGHPTSVQGQNDEPRMNEGANDGHRMKEDPNDEHRTNEPPLPPCLPRDMSEGPLLPRHCDLNAGQPLPRGPNAEPLRPRLNERNDAPPTRINEQNVRVLHWSNNSNAGSPTRNSEPRRKPPLRPSERSAERLPRNDRNVKHPRNADHLPSVDHQRNAKLPPHSDRNAKLRLDNSNAEHRPSVGRHLNDRNAKLRQNVAPRNLPKR